MSLTRRHVVAVRSESDVAEASRLARELANALGFGATDAVQIATAVSEIAANQLRHADGSAATMTIDGVEGPRGHGLSVEAVDEGPGIDDHDRALEDGWSSRGGLGLGLPGARRLMDDFRVENREGGGTRVVMVKWRDPPRAAVAERLAAWAVAGPPRGTGRVEAVVQSFPQGLMLAVSDTVAAARLRAHPGLPPPAALEASEARDAVVASFSGLDGQLTWVRTGVAGGMLLRRRGDRVSVVASAPRHRAETIGVRRGDVLLLASHAPQEPPAGADLREMADAAARPAGAALAARLDRGVLERRPRR